MSGTQICHRTAPYCISGGVLLTAGFQILQDSYESRPPFVSLYYVTTIGKHLQTKHSVRSMQILLNLQGLNGSHQEVAANARFSDFPSLLTTAPEYKLYNEKLSIQNRLHLL